MDRKTRVFEHASAKREALGLMLAITGSTGSGKTYSALRLATGMQRIAGGKIWGIDTEGGGKRMAKYSDYFQFEHVPFLPPYGPLDYLDVINQCVKEGAKILIIDSMSHEHDGEGGVLDQIDENMDRMSRGDIDKRNAYKWTAQIIPKRDRKKLNRRLIDLAGSLFIIICYRAEDKTKPGDNGKALHLGWQPVSTSGLKYETDARFLLLPCSDGKPTINPAEEAEKLLVKNARQFATWAKPDCQLDEAMGEAFAKWAIGDAPKSEPKTKAPSVDLEFLKANIKAAASLDALKSIWESIYADKERIGAASMETLKDEKDRMKKQLMGSAA